jgi:hypothetical protein
MPLSSCSRLHKQVQRSPHRPHARKANEPSGKDLTRVPSCYFLTSDGCSLFVLMFAFTPAIAPEATIKDGRLAIIRGALVRKYLRIKEWCQYTKRYHKRYYQDDTLEETTSSGLKQRRTSCSPWQPKDGSIRTFRSRF